MKKILLLAVLIIASCNKDEDCEADKKALTENYQTQLTNAGHNQAQIAEVNKQYQKRLAELNCD